MGSLKKKVKKLGRKVSKVAAKAAPVVTGVLGAAATVFAGPAAGAAITAAGAGIGRYAGAAAARDKGKHGREARKEGRKVMQKAFKYGLIGTGAAFAGTSLATGALSFGGLAGQAAGKVAPKAGAPNPTNVYDDPMAEGYAGAEYESWSPSGVGGASVPGTSQTKGGAGPSHPFGVTDILNSIPGVLGGGPSSDPGRSNNGLPQFPGLDGKPGDATTDTSAFEGESGGKGMLSNPLVLAGGAIAILFLFFR
jgi:hypothetical protein